MNEQDLRDNAWRQSGHRQVMCPAGEESDTSGCDYSDSQESDEEDAQNTGEVP